MSTRKEHGAQPDQVAGSAISPTFDPLRQELRGAYSIEASAGTGKTYSITLLWLRLLVEDKLQVDQILVTTFTKAATAELKDRLLASLRKAIASAKGEAVDGPEAEIVAKASAEKGAKSALISDVGRPSRLRSCLGKAGGTPAPLCHNLEPFASADGGLVRRLETAMSNFDLAPVYTIHGFCQSMISRQVLELGADPDVELVTDCSEIRDEIVDDELMRQADGFLLDGDKMRRVAKDITSNPLATILPRMDVDSLGSRCLEKVAPFLKQIDSMNIPPRSLASIKREIQNACESGATASFTAPQKKSLGPLLDPLEATLNEMRGLHRAKAAAGYHSLGEKIRQEYSKRKSDANQRSFDDILLTVHAALGKEGSPLASEVRKRFKAVIVDECQDSDEIQIGIFQRLFLHHDVQTFLVIGDPKQSIYRFRGADLASYRGLAGKVAQAPEMKTNHRSDKPLVDALNRLYEGREAFDECLAEDHDFKAGGGEEDAGANGAKLGLISDERRPSRLPSCLGKAGGTPAPLCTDLAPFDAGGIRYVKVEAKAERSRIYDSLPGNSLRVIWSDKSKSAGARRDLADRVAAECHRLLRSNVDIEDAKGGGRRRIQASDIAVLCSTNKELALVRKALQQRGVASQMAGRGLGHVLASEESRDVLAWLCTLSALERRAEVLSFLLAFCSTPLVGMGAHDLLALHSDAEAQARVCQGILRELEDLRWQGPLPLLLRRITAGAAQAKNLSHRDGERRLTNWRQIGSLLQEEWFAGRHGACELAQWLKRAMGRAGSKAEENMMKLETDLPAVQLATIHSAKGLEYPVVFCPFLWTVKSQSHRSDRPIAILRTAQGTLVDLGSDDFLHNLELDLEQSDEESQRLLYVALTRARHRVYLGLAPVDAGQKRFRNGAENSALAKLLGLSDLPKSEWLDKLESLPLEVMGNVSLPLRQAPASEVSLGAASPALADPPEAVDFQHWPLRRCASYSSLARSAHEDESHFVRDYDAEGDPELQSSKEGLLGGLDSSGILLGTEIHSILEEILGNRKSLDAVLASRPKWREPVEIILSATLIFGEDAISLRDMKSLAEMHFLIPANGRFEPHALAAALLGDPAIHADSARRDWAQSLAGWSFNALHGYFQGYIDLIFERQGRWYVADYKSNLLPDYGCVAVKRAMLGSHYLLQSRLYVLALHRHLSATLNNYDYDKHIGGSAWLFLRGFPGEGVWFERPDRKSVEQLDQLFKGNHL